MKLRSRTLTLAALLTATLLTGCAGSPSNSFCTTAEALGWPLYLSADDSLTRGTAEVIVGTFEYGEKACGWKAVGE